jgi:hypothetical protein
MPPTPPISMDPKKAAFLKMLADFWVSDIVDTVQGKPVAERKVVGVKQLKKLNNISNYR